MEDLPFLSSYTGQSTDDLIALAESFRIDSIVCAFEEALSTKTNHTAPERIVLVIEALEREVNNGGYNQFFVNSSREYTANIVDALIAIGCPKTARLTQKAIDALGLTDLSNLEEIEDAACDTTDVQDERLSQLDEIYYCGEEEPIADKLFEYIKQNRSAISLAPP